LWLSQPQTSISAAGWRQAGRRHACGRPQIAGFAGSARSGVGSPDKPRRNGFSFAAEWNIVAAADSVPRRPRVVHAGALVIGGVAMNLRVPVFLEAVLGASLVFGLTGEAVAADKAIAIELNKATNTDAGCRLTFVVKNDTESLLEKTSYEIAAFDAAKTVMKLLVFEFGRLPVGKTKVVEFALAGVACTNISRILVNTAPECIADGAASTICLDALRTSSLAPIVFDQ
jgi:hypothetical protein